MSEDITNDQVDTSQQEPASLSTDWRESLPEDIRSEASLQSINSIDDLAKSYVNSQKMIGNSLRIPSEDASEEALNEFYSKLEGVKGVARLDSDDIHSKLGWPEDKADYSQGLPEDIELDQERFERYAELAHESKMTKEQFQSLIKLNAAEAQAQSEANEKSFLEGQNKLKEVWGQDFENRLQGAQEAAKMYSEKYPEAMEQLLNSDMSNNPAVLSMFSELYSAMKETGVVDAKSSGPNYGMTPDEAKAQIADIRSNKAHPFNNSRDPAHKEAVKKMNKLYEALYS